MAGFLKSMKNYERIRTCGADIPMEMYEEAARIDKYIATAKPVKDGRVELIHYIKSKVFHLNIIVMVVSGGAVGRMMKYFY